MGGSASRESRLGMTANFTPEEIRRLGVRFEKLDRDGSGSISIQEFMSLPEIKKNPIALRVISVFDVDGNGEVDFKEFIRGMSLISCKGDNVKKLRFAFSMYDLDKDGLISNGELFKSLKTMVGDNLESAQLQQIVDKTIVFGDLDGDGKISFDEFVELVVGADGRE